MREARRLLTQGLSFNDNSTFLLLELLKLEGAAADFFSKRVSLRKKQAAYEKSETMAVDDAEENEPDTKKTMKVGRQRRQNRNPAETDMKDAMAFVSKFDAILVNDYTQLNMWWDCARHLFEMERRF